MKTIFSKTKVGLQTWHLIDGEWVNIGQLFENGTVKYYTNGELEGERELIK